MADFLVLPIFVPAVTAMVCALLRDRPRLERVIAMSSSIAMAGFSFFLLAEVDRVSVLAVVVGGWEAPWGIALVADRLSAIMLCLSTSVGAIVVAYTLDTVTSRQQRAFFHPLFQVVLLGVNWSFLSGDLFNLFVAYEVMLIGSYGSMMVGAAKPQVRQTFKYVAINGIGSTLFVSGIALVYATVGTTNLADLARRTAVLEGEAAALVTAISMVLLVVFALKTAAFPLFYWLPDSYPIVPAGVNGFFAGLLTKVGVYSLLRIYLLVFRQEGHELATSILLVLSGTTMIFGVLGAMCQWEIRRILSWHIISQVGYMVMGIGLAADSTIARMAVAGTIFYVVHHIVVKSSLFLIGGIAGRISGTQELRRMGGLLDTAPVVAGFFLIASFSLAGLPPFSGFLSKFVLVRAGLAGGHWVVVGVSLVTSFLTLYSMTKIWSYSFWGEPVDPVANPSYRRLVAPTGILVAFTVVMGLFAEPFLRLADSAAEDLLAATPYIEAVLGPGAESEPW